MLHSTEVYPSFSTLWVLPSLTRLLQFAWVICHLHTQKLQGHPKDPIEKQTRERCQCEDKAAMKPLPVYTLAWKKTQIKPLKNTFSHGSLGVQVPMNIRLDSFYLSIN